MRKTLLSMTALVAAGLLVTSVAYAGDEEMAEEEMMEEEMMAQPVSVSVAGSARVTLSLSSDDSSPTIWEHFEPTISGSATMDNGLTFGVSTVIDLSGSWFDGGLAYDRKLSISSAFGDIELGQIKGARASTRIAAPGATSSFGVNGPYTAGIAKAVGTDGSGFGGPVRDDKIVYRTPALGGLSIAVSYAPDGSDAKAATADSPAVPAANNQMAGALSYSQGLGDANVSVNVGYERAERGNNNPTDMNAGISISVDDVSVGGGMRRSEAGDNGLSTTQYDVGATVSMGAATLGVGWGGTDTSNMYALGVAYPLGEGVQLDMQLDFGETDAADSDWVQFMIGTAISF